MLQPKAFKLRQAEERRNNYTGALPEIDKKRATAVLVRQSKSGADTAMAESRETQLGLQEYSKLLYGNKEPDVIVNNHPAVLDYALFAEGYARLKGYTLEGEPVDNYRGKTRIRETRESPPDLLFHGKLLLTPHSPDEIAYISAYEQIYRQESTFNYLGYRKPKDQMTDRRSCCIPGVAFDDIVIKRLLALEQADIEMKDRVKATLEQVYNQQSEDFVSIPQQIDGIKIQLVENAKKRMKTGVDDPMYSMLEEEKHDLMERQKSLEAKKEKLGMMDSSEEIEQLHSLLGNFEAVWPTFDLAQRQRAFSLLINRIEVEIVSPHWIRLSIDWLDAVCPRLDLAYIWKASPSRGEKFRDEEKEIIRQYYPRGYYMEILKMLPSRTWQSVQGQAALMGVRREIPADRGICMSVCYKDLVPKLDGKYLFRDDETTLGYIKKAASNTAKSEAPLYALWIFSETVESLTGLVQRYLGTEDCLSQPS